MSFKEEDKKDKRLRSRSRGRQGELARVYALGLLLLERSEQRSQNKEDEYEYRGYSLIN